MARTGRNKGGNKGPRSRGFTVRFPEALGDPDLLASKLGFSSVSQMCADLTCIQAGKPRLALEAHQLLLASGRRTGLLSHPSTRLAFAESVEAEEADAALSQVTSAANNANAKQQAQAEHVSEEVLKAS